MKDAIRRLKLGKKMRSVVILLLCISLFIGEKPLYQQLIQNVFAVSVSENEAVPAEEDSIAVEENEGTDQTEGEQETPASTEQEESPDASVEDATGEEGNPSSEAEETKEQTPTDTTSGNSTTPAEEEALETEEGNNREEDVEEESVSGNSISENALKVTSAALDTTGTVLSTTAFVPPAIPGYTQVQGAVPDTTREVLIVSVDSSGNIYALYPSANGLNMTPGSGTAQAATTVKLNVNRLTSEGLPTAATIASPNTPVEIIRCEWLVRESGGKYSFRGPYGQYLNMNTKFYTTAETFLTVTQGEAAGNDFVFRNLDTGGDVRRRRLALTVQGDNGLYSYETGNDTPRFFAFTSIWAPLVYYGPLKTESEASTSKFYLYYRDSNPAVPSVGGDTRLLQEAYDGAMAQGNVEENFVPASWQTYQAALDAAQAVIADRANRSQSEIDAARTALENALNNLVRKTPVITGGTLDKIYDGSSVDTGLLTLELYGRTGAVSFVFYDSTGTVTLTGAPADAGSYQVEVVVAADGNSPEVRLAKVGFTIEKREITPEGAQILPKNYDGNTTATVNRITFADLPQGVDLVKGTHYTANGVYAGKDVNTSSPVTVTVALTTEGAKNYTLASTTLSVAASIGKAPLTIQGASIAPKSNDGTTDAQVTEVRFGGLVNHETLQLGTDYLASGVFDSANPEVASKVTITVQLLSAKSDNYRLVDDTYELNAGILANTRLSGILDKVYDGQPMPADPTTLAGCEIDPYGRGGQITYTYYTNASCTVPVAGGAPTNAGTYWVKAHVASDGVYPDNESNALAFTIRRRPLSLDVSRTVLAQKVYDGTTDAEIASAAFTGLVSSDQLTAQDYTVSGYFNSPDVADANQVSLVVQLKAGVLKDNYSFNQTNYVKTGVSITPKTITITGAQVSSKNEDGNRDGVVSSVTFDGLVHTLPLVWGQDYHAEAAFEDASVGETKRVTVRVTLGPSEGSQNYRLASDTYEATAAIFSNVSLSGSLDKVYDGTVVDPENTQSLIGSKGSRTGSTSFEYSQDQTFTRLILAPKNAGTYWVRMRVEADGTHPESVSNALPFTISRREITITAATITPKTYDGTVHAEVTAITFGNSLTAEPFTLDRDYRISGAAFNSPDVANATQVGMTVSLLQNRTTDNYVLTTSSYQQTGVTIAKKEIQLTDVTIYPKSNDGTAEARIKSIRFTGLLAGQTLVMGIDYEATGTFNTNDTTASRLTVEVTLKDSLKAQNYTVIGSPFTKTGSDIVITENVELRGTMDREYTGSAVDAAALVQNQTLTLDTHGRTGAVSYKYYADSAGTLELAEAPKDAGTYSVRAVVAAAGDWEENSSAPLVFTIHKKEIRIHQAAIAFKTYDSTKSAMVTEVDFSGLITSEALEKDRDYRVSGEFNDANVNQATHVKVQVVLLGTDVTQNYRLASPTFHQTSSISKASLTIDHVAIQHKNAGTGTQATILEVIFAGLKGSDSLAIGTDYRATGTFANDNPDAANNQVNGRVQLLDTLMAGNYDLTTDTFTQAAEVHRLPSFTGSLSKSYDGTAVDPSSLTINRGGRPDSLPVVWKYYPTQQDAEAGRNALTNAPKDAGTYYMTLTIEGDGGQWADATSHVVAFTIDQAALTAVVTPDDLQDKTYDGTTGATVTRVTFNGLAGGEVLTKDTDYRVRAAFNSADVRDGDRVSVTLELTSSATAANYRLENPVVLVSKSITRRTLTIRSAQIEKKSNDGTADARVTQVEFADIVSPDDLALDRDYTATGTFADTTAGSHDVTIRVTLGNTLMAENYAIAGPYTLVGQSITDNLVLRGSLDKVYDGQKVNAATGLSLDLQGREGGTVRYEYYADSLAAGRLEEAPKDAGTYYVRAFYEGSQTWPDNQSNLMAFTIRQKPINVAHAAVSSKGYDGKETATVSSVDFDALVTGESFEPDTDYRVSAVYNSPNVKDANRVTVTVTLISGEKTDNYKLNTQMIEVGGQITPKEVTITGAVTVPKSKDGTADVQVSDVTLSGLVEGDQLTYGADYQAFGVFNNANPGTGKTVTVTVTMLDTVRGSNYTPNPNTYTLRGMEIKENTTLTNDQADKVYDGQPIDERKLLAGDQGRNSTIIFKYYTDPAGTAELGTKPVNAGVYWVKAVAQAGQWPENESSLVQLVIRKAPLTIVDFTLVEKTYDGTSDGQVSGVRFEGLAAAETLQQGREFTVDGSYNSADVDYANHLTAVVILTPGTTADNYYLTKATVEKAAGILKKDIRLTTASVSGKTYDGNAQAQVANIDIEGMIAGQQLTLGRDYTAQGSFNSPHVAEADKVIVRVVTEDTTLARNYNFTNTSLEVAEAIRPRDLRLSGAVVQNKTFDGTNKAVVLNVSFSGLVAGEKLTVEKDYQMEGSFDLPGPGTAIPVTVRATLAGSISARNYRLILDNTKGSADIAYKVSLTDPTGGTGGGSDPGNVFLTAMDKLYDGKAADPGLLKLNAYGRPGGVSYVFFTDQNGQNKLSAAPAAAGTYYVQAVVEAKQNWPEEKSALFAFTIHQAPLTITKANIVGKIYDGTTKARIKSVQFDGLVDKEKLTAGKDYTVTGAYHSAQHTIKNRVDMEVVLLHTDLASNYRLTAAAYSQAAVITTPSTDSLAGEGETREESEEEAVVPTPAPAPAPQEVPATANEEAPGEQLPQVPQQRPGKPATVQQPTGEAGEKEEASGDSNPEANAAVLKWYTKADGSLGGREIPITDSTGKAYTLVYDLMQSSREAEVLSAAKADSLVAEKLSGMNQHQVIDIWLKDVESGKRVDASGKVSFIIPYPEGTDSSFPFIITNVTSGGNSYILTKELEYTLTEEGFLITAESLDSYIVSWNSLSKEEDTKTISWQAAAVGVLLMLLLLLGLWWILIFKKRKKKKE